MKYSPGYLALTCLLVSSASLGAGYASFGLVAGVALVPLIFWVAAHWRPSTGLITTALLISICAASVGMLVGAAPLWMIFGAVLALAGWDLELLSLKLSSSSSNEGTTSLLSQHVLALGLVVGLGLLLAGSGRMLALQIPLAGMILLAVLTLFALEHAWRSLTK